MIFRLYILLIGLILSGCNSLPVNDEDFKEIPFETIEQGHFSGFTIAFNRIIQTESCWRDTWSLLESRQATKTPLPQIDFRNNVVVVTAMGEQTSGGYANKIDKVVYYPSSNRVEIDVLEASPRNDFAVVAVITQPYHIISIPLTANNPSLKKNTIVWLRGQ